MLLRYKILSSIQTILLLIYVLTHFILEKNNISPELLLVLSMGQVYFARNEISKLMFYALVLQTLATVMYFVITLK